MHLGRGRHRRPAHAEIDRLERGVAETDQGSGPDEGNESDEEASAPDALALSPPVDEVVAGITNPTVVAAVIAALGLYLQEVQRGRGQSSHRTVARFKDEVAAIEAWRTTRTALLSDGRTGDDSHQRALADLDAAYTRFRNGFTDTDDTSSALVRTFKSALLLDLPQPRRGRTTAWRVGYWASLALWPLWAAAWGSTQRSWADPGEWAASVMTFFIAAVIPTLLVRAGARRSAAKAAQVAVLPQQRPPQGSPAAGWPAQPGHPQHRSAPYGTARPSPIPRRS